ncbi:methylaspartate mutase sigma subunit [Allocatelliglobosispora scoriae]|uniref:Methylaspartate mutase sigma subunit n=1 Tax=Allocatelliglobosispora scoriae TaxID=643052 RepID=A0A841C055_9ACTN|nr:cobalamin-dependent protein [Allocatelliglobosispora scoriae]MBB5872729.1 methylaspartate mutase sigma subunit [Allocatelliglobosispora scoriae]
MKFDELARLVESPSLNIVVTSMSSDSHTWNLVYLQLVLEELGHRVVNLGACTPDEVIVESCLDQRPDLIVMSSVNGHGRHDGARVIRAIRGCPELAATPVVIGGKLDVAAGADGGVTAELLAAGFDGVFTGSAAIAEFRAFVAALPVPSPRELIGATPTLVDELTPVGA